MSLDVAVIIPVLNATGTLPTQLAALAGQDFEGSWEIVLADNGSTDDLAGCLEQLLDSLAGLPPCRIIDASHLAGASYARTIALLHVDAQLLAFCDSDDIVAPGWLSALVEGLASFGVMTGPLSGFPAAMLETRSPAWLFEHQPFDREADRLTFIGGGVMGCNCAFRREALAGFAPDYLSAEDSATALRALDAGFAQGWAEGARILYRQRSTAKATFAKALGIAVGQVQLAREFPDRVTLTDRPVAMAGWLGVHLGGLLRSRSRLEWSRVAGRFMGLSLERHVPGLYVGVVRARRARHAQTA